MATSLAHNLDVRRDACIACWACQVGWIGDPAHASGCSDHNADSRGVVHAIDVMVTGARAEAVVSQCLAHHDDLEYVIHNRTIWSRSSGWAPRKYTGSDPHTNHVHVSGRHGSTGENSHTCNGYDTSAEKVTPAFAPCSVSASIPSGVDDMQGAKIIQKSGDGTKPGTHGSILVAFGAHRVPVSFNHSADGRPSLDDWVALLGAVGADTNVHPVSADVWETGIVEGILLTVTGALPASSLPATPVEITDADAQSIADKTVAGMAGAAVVSTVTSEIRPPAGG